MIEPRFPPWYIERYLNYQTPWKFFMRRAMGTPWHLSFTLFAALAPTFVLAEILLAVFPFWEALGVEITGSVAYFLFLARTNHTYQFWWGTYDTALAQYESRYQTAPGKGSPQIEEWHDS